MSRPEQDNTSSSVIATKAELLQRLRDRSKPQVQSRLTPNGPSALESRKTLLRENERRIGVLRASLGSAHDAFEVQHSFATLDGYAKARFEKSR